MLDFLLLLMVVIWGSNFAVVKAALVDFPALPFNALRLVVSSAIFLAAIALQARRAPGATPPLTRADWRQLVFLGLLGQLVYQWCFVEGVARTSVGNAALIFGCTPVTVAILASLAGHERIPRMRWAGAALSLAGIYAVVGHRASWAAEGLIGDAIVIAAMFCWSLYSVAAQPLLARHSALTVTGWSMAIGASCYVLAALPAFATIDWSAISVRSWWLMLGSSVLSLAVAYMIWYTAVQRIGSSRTSMYSNLTPVVAMVTGFLWLGEPITRGQLMGTAAILTGVFVTRMAGRG